MKRIGIVGAGRFGTSLAECLGRRGAEVLLLDRNRDTIQRLAPIVAKAVQGDASDQRVLSEAGFQECDTAVVAIGTNIEGSILATMNLKELKVREVVAKAVTDMHGRVLERIGADLVVFPDKERAERLARSILSHSAVDFYEILEGVSVVELPAPKSTIGKTLADAKIRRNHGLTVLAIKRQPDKDEHRENIVSPSGEDIIEEGDTLILFGPDDRLEDIS